MTALFCPKQYSGEFATIHFQDERGWQVTLWQCGQPIRYTPHELLSSAILEILEARFVWANWKMQQAFENDVLMSAE